MNVDIRVETNALYKSLGNHLGPYPNCDQNWITITRSFSTCFASQNVIEHWDKTTYTEIILCICFLFTLIRQQPASGCYQYSLQHLSLGVTPTTPFSTECYVFTTQPHEKPPKTECSIKQRMFVHFVAYLTTDGSNFEVIPGGRFA